LFATGWYCALKGSNDAGTKAMLSSFAHWIASDALVIW